MQALRVGVPLAAALLVSVSSCKGRGQTSPSPTPTVTSVTISAPTDMLKVKETATFAATALHSDGASAPVTDWRSDTPSVATVDAATGKVTGVSAGAATIVATHDGMSATRLVRVVPDFAGTWAGGFVITGCSASGVFATKGNCNTDTTRVGSTGTVRFEDLRQDRDNVEGYLEYPVLWAGKILLTTVVVRGTITAGGHLPLTGAYSGPFTLALTSGGTDLYIDSDRMAGSFSLDLGYPGVEGALTLRHAPTGGGLTKVGTFGAQFSPLI